MEFIKGNNQTTETKIKIVTTLPVTGNENDIVLLKEDGIYQYKNSQWNCVTSFITAAAPPIIGEIRASIGTPDGNWLLCNGSSFSQSDYPKLYNLLGGTTLPDFRELIPIGVGTNNTDSVIDHDTFTRGEVKDWNLQTHTHSKTESGHTHSATVACHRHSYSYYCFKGIGTDPSGDYSFVCKCTVNTTSTTSGPGVGNSCAYTSAISFGNPSSGTAILRVNSYGVNFYIRAK